ncbi:MAG: ABC transporter substrate binding protein, partial [Microvirga sp.]
ALPSVRRAQPGGHRARVQFPRQNLGRDRRGEGVTQAHRETIAELAAKHRLPAIYGGREFVEAGGLIFYGPSFTDIYRRLATYADKIFKGAKPADLPVEQPTKLELVINGGAARALGLEIPPGLRLLADEVIE